MMRDIFILSALLIMGALRPTPAKAEERIAQPVYGDFFRDQALRVDLVHTGTRGKEMFGVEGIVIEPIWPGTRAYPIDTTGFGKYRFRVLDKATQKEIFSKGYCTLFGEWLTTPEAGAGVWRSMTESLRMPLPKAPIELILEVRLDKTGEFEEIQRFDIDTLAYDLSTEHVFEFDVEVLHDSGRSPAHALDIVIVPDGYTEQEEEKLLRDARRFSNVIVSTAPFDRNNDKITIRLVKAFSRESGPDEPRKGIFRDTIVGTGFDTFRSARYLTTPNMKRLAQVAGQAPYDTIIVMVNSCRYGGGGIFNSYSIFTSDSEYSEYVLIHEFGHGFGALGDEYFDSSTGYEEDAFYAKGVEPWEPNLTVATKRDQIKWKHLILDDTPIPTPDAEEYENAVGLFEGGGYKAKGLFRPTRDSKMFHKGLLPFGPVNEDAIEKMIHYFTDKEAAE